MSGAGRRAAGALAAVLATAALVALSRAPYDTGQGDAAVVRLSWSGRPERIERCRELSDDELAARPAHMRRRLECEGRSARYAVRLLVDGSVVLRDTVTGGGLRGDRAIHMLWERRVAPGRRVLAVEVSRVETTGERTAEESAEDAATDTLSLDRGARERAERRRERQEAMPPRLVLDTAVNLGPGAVALVTYDASARRLVALTAGPAR